MNLRIYICRALGDLDYSRMVCCVLRIPRVGKCLTLYCGHAKAKQEEMHGFFLLLAFPVGCCLSFRLIMPFFYTVYSEAIVVTACISVGLDYSFHNSVEI